MLKMPASFVAPALADENECKVALRFGILRIESEASLVVGHRAVGLMQVAPGEPEKQFGLIERRVAGNCDLVSWNGLLDPACFMQGLSIIQLSLRTFRQYLSDFRCSLYGRNDAPKKLGSAERPKRHEQRSAA